MFQCMMIIQGMTSVNLNQNKSMEKPEMTKEQLQKAISKLEKSEKKFGFDKDRAVKIERFKSQLQNHD